jgi:hypothetical protein
MRIYSVLVASHAAPVEKVNSDKMVIDEEDHSQKKQQPIATTNTVF